jgi:hypothetical protein
MSAIEASEVSAVSYSRSDPRVTIGLDSGAEITVWPPELVLEIPTEDSPESRRGVKYYCPGGTVAPSLPNLGERVYESDIGGVRRHANVQIVPVRKPLSAQCDFEDHGHDVFFVDGRRWARRRESGEVLEMHRRGGRYELDARVILPSN